MKRELRTVAADRVVGAVIRDARGIRWEGAAKNLLRGERLRSGDAKVAADLLARGWSNGYVYLAAATKGD